VGQRTFETRSLYLILAEMLFTLPAANERLPLSALFAGKYREVGIATNGKQEDVEQLVDEIRTELSSGKKRKA
jgi:hypothetical protein